MKNKITFFCLSLIVNIVFAITVDGHAFLENQTNHSGIEVFLVRTAPDSISYTIYTNTGGYYTSDIETGIYDIMYSKDNYFYQCETDEMLFSNTTLSEVTLLEHTTILNVPSVFSTIQSAIDQAFTADTVLVSIGSYVENINFFGKNITVSSLFITSQDTSYISQTVIDGNNSGHVVNFENGEDTTAVLCGFTIINGFTSIYPNDSGGGIYCFASSPSLVNLRIASNVASHFGGGIACSQSSPILRNVTIANNSAEVDGGGISCIQSSPILRNVTIVNNNAEGNGGGISCGSSNMILENVIIIGNRNHANGGGFSCNYSSPSLHNVTISNNTSEQFGGGISCHESNPSIFNSIVSDNIGNHGLHVFSGNPTIYYSDFYDNQNGNFYNCGQWIGVNVTINANGDSCDVYNNIQMDPCFVDTANGDYHLTNISPCIDAGDPTSQLDPDGTIVDIGKYYYDQNQPSADFTSDAIYGLIPFDVNFIDLSSPGILGNPIIEWHWDFNNDGVIESNEQNPLFSYIEAGLYTVTLTISDGLNTVSETKVDYITVGEQIIADFEADPLEGLIPLEVQFTDMSSGGLPSLSRVAKLSNKPTIDNDRDSRDIIYWEWDFDNDGIIDSNEQNPVYSYTETGIYTVSLTVGDGVNTESETKVDYINASLTGIGVETIHLETNLIGSYPNPFNPSTTIRYYLKESANVKILIFNIKGQIVNTLVKQNQDTGYHSVVWDGKDFSGNPVSSGLYLYKLIGDNRNIDMKTCLLIK